MTDRARLLKAILPHVPFDGWSDAAFAGACDDMGLSQTEGRALAPRGALDLAVDHHLAGDTAMRAALAWVDLAAMRFRDRVAHALRLRLLGLDKEAVRRASALFALPHHVPEGARLIWGTADAVWTALGDSAQDLNWYTKRATLAAVWAAVVLYWLGDSSPDGQATDAFIDRRIDDVMQIEKLKAQVNAVPWLRPLTGALSRMAQAVRAPGQPPAGGFPDDLPGYWAPHTPPADQP